MGSGQSGEYTLKPGSIITQFRVNNFKKPEVGSRIDGEMVESRFGTYIAEWPCFDTREWGRHTVGQMIAWNGGYSEGGKMRVSEGCCMAAAVWYLSWEACLIALQHVSAQSPRHAMGVQPYTSGPTGGPHIDFRTIQ